MEDYGFAFTSAQGICRVNGCLHELIEETPDLAQAAIDWHVYEEHPEEWVKVRGGQPPEDPDPRTKNGRIIINGRRFQLRLPG